MRARTSSPKPAAAVNEQKEPKQSSSGDGSNFSEAMGAGGFFPVFAVIFCPLLTQVLAFITTDERLATPTLGGFYDFIKEFGWAGWKMALVPTPTLGGCGLLAAFMGLARLLCELPGEVVTGPLTATGHLPKYVDNGRLHCFIFSVIFVGCSSVGLGLYDLTAMFDNFFAVVSALNIFALLFCAYLTWKGLNMPDTQDSGSTGSFVLDYYWGTELYPRILGVDVKRFVNCRFSMTFWQVAGISFLARSYERNGEIDYGLLFAALSQYIYLAKFFWWEIGYMRSIDIIVDRAGFYETWGCLVFVPSVYTLHSRLLVKGPSQLSLPVAFFIFVVGIAGVFTNFWADMQRQRFREADGKIKIWGKEPNFIEAEYTVQEDGVSKTKRSLLLASGFWGISRHFHYVPELVAAYSWGFLGNPAVNGLLPLFYPCMLTCLLLHRAIRDEEKCSKKYGKDYEKYKALVPYKMVPYIY
jgi:7-dehydrocholesterol reductase